ncbi:MAG: hypothetical protein KC652_19785 [Cyanobacteria bacterium HKST-UBA01]|nr:hypothetical protein [Cyanobacteria bacterium HKST-UBA01]
MDFDLSKVTPKRCREELEEVLGRGESFRNNGWKETEVDADCKLHFFINHLYWKKGDLKPSNAAFGNPGLSVRGDGGNFSPLTKKDLIEILHSLSRETGQNFVGSVYFKASQLKEDNELSSLIVIHDPHPFEDKHGVFQPQAENHIEIICNKNTTRRDLLQEACDWSLHPDEVE